MYSKFPGLLFVTGAVADVCHRSRGPEVIVVVSTPTRKNRTNGVLWIGVSFKRSYILRRTWSLACSCSCSAFQLVRCLTYGSFNFVCAMTSGPVLGLIGEGWFGILLRPDCRRQTFLSVVVCLFADLE